MKRAIRDQYLILHGPNLNLLGVREPEVYGTMTLVSLNSKLKAYAKAHSVSVSIKQSNHEGALIDFLHDSRSWAKGIVFNPGAFTHYSYALRDAIASISVPTVEVHLSDIMNREKFRRKSVIKEVCLAQISGLGINSYLKGLEVLINRGGA